MHPLRPTILFDGHCALCSGAIQTILRMDDKGIFQFAPLQSAYAKTLLAHTDLDLE